MRSDRRQAGLGGMHCVRGSLFLLCGSLLYGCASPGPPRPPSLFLPRVITDLAATRVGDHVALRFTVPVLSTDGQPLRVRSVLGVLCRQDAKGVPCRPVDTAETMQPLPVPGPGGAPVILWTDNLPVPLHSGTPRPIAYRIELKAPSGASAGYSDPVYTAAGTAPAPVSDFRAESIRAGVALHWQAKPDAGEIMLRRAEPEKTVTPARAMAPASQTLETASSGKGKGRARGAHGAHLFPEKRTEADPAVVWLQAAPGDQDAAATIDNSIEPGVPYRYTAVRRQRVQIGGRTLDLESSPSAEAAITWSDVLPPAVPKGLMALGYELPAGDVHQPSGYAVDLVWEPVVDRQLAGYLVFRQAMNAAQPDAEALVGSQLTPQPVGTPAFHDAAALPGQRYRYSVVAVGTNGQRSAAVTAEVAPYTGP